jgi:outer membrane biosynthesis protein TonB
VSTGLRRGSRAGPRRVSRARLRVGEVLAGLGDARFGVREALAGRAAFRSAAFTRRAPFFGVALAVLAAFLAALGVTLVATADDGQPAAERPVGSLAVPLEGAAPAPAGLSQGAAAEALRALEDLALDGVDPLPALATDEPEPAPPVALVPAPAPAPAAPAPRPRISAPRRPAVPASPPPEPAPAPEPVYTPPPEPVAPAPAPAPSPGPPPVEFDDSG